MKFCPVVPEICHGQVHDPRKERRKRKRRIIIIIIIIRNGANININQIDRKVCCLGVEHLHTKYFSLNLMSNLRSQYLPIAFQLSNGSCKIRYRSLILLLSINYCMLIIPMPPFSTPRQQTFLSI
jgi:hypothetical protein